MSPSVLHCDCPSSEALVIQISLFEDLVDNTIEDTKSIPQDVATTGKVKMSRRDIMKHIGELFILRININLQGSVLDSPELMWAVSRPDCIAPP